MAAMLRYTRVGQMREWCRVAKRFLRLAGKRALASVLSNRQPLLSDLRVISTLIPRATGRSLMESSDHTCNHVLRRDFGSNERPASLPAQRVVTRASTRGNARDSGGFPG